MKKFLSANGLIPYFAGLTLIIHYSLFTIPCSAQIVINEICSSNDALIPDEDGDYEDWIELYNPTNSLISLKNYRFIYEEPNEPTATWIFPQQSYIRPKSHLLLWASGKDRKEIIDHYEVPVFADSVWRYKANSFTPPDTNWYQSNYNDLTWSQGIGGFGYGDGDDNTNVIFANSVFVRKSFFVPDTSRYPYGVLMIDYDDAFVAYLNGQEVARSNIGVYGDHPAYNTSAYEEHEALLYRGMSPEFYFVPLEGILEPGINVLAVQVNNFSLGMDDLSLLPWLIFASTDTSSVFLSFPADAFMHTNFSFSNTNGYKISLTDSLGNIVDTRTFVAKDMQPNNSRGRNPDGGNNWCLFLFPTPNDTNDVSPCFEETYVQEPSLSLPAGFYSGPQTLSISSIPPNTTVFYTRNGNIPTGADAAYMSPITIDSTQVIRARAFSNTGLYLPGKTVTNTYFINENISLPVISLCTDSLNLWDDTTGIYVLGPFADSISPYNGANFWNDWERQAHTEYFALNKTQGFEQDCAVKIHGNASRSFPQKSFRILANDDYQDPWINYRLFPDKNIDKFKNFNIRNAGIDWNTTHLRDRLMQKIAMQTNIDVMDGEPAVLFLNGRYFGVYEIREKQDKYYLANNHNVDPLKVDLLRFEGDIMEGSNQAFFEMVNFIGNSDMTIQTNYDSALKLIDLPNYCDYFIAETYYENNDWIWIDPVNQSQGTNNIKFWRTNSPPGKWRYILWDTDVGLGLMERIGFIPDYLQCQQGYLNAIIDSSIIFPSVHVLMFTSMLKNISFRNYFINRYCDLMNTVFEPFNFEKKTLQLRDEMKPDMTRQFTKWGVGPIQIFPPMPAYVGLAANVPEWLNEMDSLVDFLYCRPQYVRDSIQTEFSLVKQVNVTLNVSPEYSGNIKLNTITQLDSLPWSGIYFDGVPVTMTATANAGYQFSHWQSPNLLSNPNTNSSVTINVTQDEPFTAYFTRLEMAFNVYPNPFWDDFTLYYELPQDAQVSVKMYNIIGQQVREIISADHFETAGVHQLSIEEHLLPLASGMYFIRFNSGEFSKTVKILKTKK